MMISRRLLHPIAVVSLVLGPIAAQSAAQVVAVSVFGVRAVDLDANEAISSAAVSVGLEGGFARLTGAVLEPVSGRVFALSGETGDTHALVVIDPASWTATAVGSSGRYLTALAAGDDGALYALAEDRVVTLDPATAVASDLATVPAGSPRSSGGLVFRPQDGKLYVFDRSSSGWIFLRVDPSNGATTSLQVVGLPVVGSPGALAAGSLAVIGGELLATSEESVYRVVLDGESARFEPRAEIARDQFYDRASVGVEALLALPLDPTCNPTPDRLCLGGGRFRVEVDWNDGQGSSGAGTADQSTTDSGRFWFFSPDNIELIVKVLNACAINQRFWVFGSASTDVGYTLRIVDTATGATKEYRNNAGNTAPAITDTGAFSGCP